MKPREVIDGLETILARSDMDVVLEKKELALLEEAIIYIKRYIVQKNTEEENKLWKIK